MLRSILQLILDFALEPALIDATGAFLVCLIFFSVQRRSFVRTLGGALLGYALSFIAMAAAFTAAAATGYHWFVFSGFFGVFLFSFALTGWNKGNRVTGLLWSVGIVAITWAIDAFITADILFE